MSTEELNVLVEKAEACYENGDHVEALNIYRDVEKLSRESGDEAVRINSLAARGLVSEQCGIDAYNGRKFKDALAFFKEQEYSAEETDNIEQVLKAYNNQGCALRELGSIEDALDLHKKQEAAAKEHNLDYVLALSCINQAEILSQFKGMHEEALPLSHEAVRLFTGLDLKENMQYAGNLVSTINNRITELSPVKKAAAERRSRFINLNESSQENSIRIFVSSTFRDMMEERDHLIKNVFPELRKKCLERGVELTEVDLRWGVTEEESKQGKVIDICLQEIDKCRPYFIGLIGGRYGWIPGPGEYAPKHEEDKYRWVHDDIAGGLSITEMEIQYGVLRNPEMKPRAFFYFREPGSTPEEFREKPGSAEALKLEKLKAEIDARAEHPKSVYAAAEQLGLQVSADFTAFLDREYPAAQSPSHLERIRMDHAAFARSRLKVYIGGDEYMKQLDSHVEGDDRPLVLTGESGYGKSALLANWIARRQQEHPDEFILYHFIGGAPDSTDHVLLMRRIMEEMKERFNLNDEVPTDRKKIEESFPVFLAQTPHAKRWILVIDALNQLEDKENSRWLGWVPAFIPENIRVILSALPGEALDSLRKREYPELEMHSLDTPERTKLIHEYLGCYTKKLPDDLAGLIAGSEKSANPLILRTMLDELRVFGKHEELKERIEYYLKPETPVEFFDAVLRRLENDYDGERPGLTRDVLSYIWASRRGLSEREIMDVTEIPPLYWSPLYNALENHLVSRSGLLTFFHDYIRQAVENRYLHNDTRASSAHMKLADYFMHDRLGERAVDEVPYQFEKAREWEKLKDYIGSIDVFLKLHTEEKKYELLGYWLLLDKKYDLVETYTQTLNNWEKNERDERQIAFACNQLALFFQIGGRYNGAESLYCRALDISEKVLGPESPDTAASLNNLASLLQVNGDYEGAEYLYRRALVIREKALGPDHPSTATSINNLASLLQEKGDYEGAEPLYRRALIIREKALGPDHPNTATSINNLAFLLQDTGNYEGAEPLYRRALDIFEKVLGPDHPDIATSINSLAFLLQTKGDYESAEHLYRRALAIYEKVLGNEHIHTAACINSLALLLQTKRDYKGAESLFRRALALYENILGAGHTYTATSLNNLALLLQAKGDYEGAEPLLHRALDIYQKLLGNDHPSTITIKNNLISLLEAKNGINDEVQYYKNKIEAKTKEFGHDHIETAEAIHNLANAYINTTEYEAAEPLFLEALAIREKALGPEAWEVASTLINLAVVYRNMGKYDKAEPINERAFAIYEKVLGAEHQRTINAGTNLAMLKFLMNKNTEAIALCTRFLDAHREIQEKLDSIIPGQLRKLAMCYHNFARYSDIPEKQYDAAEQHFRYAMDYYTRMNDPIQAAQAELDMLSMLKDTGRYVDEKRLKDLESIPGNGE